MENSYSIVHRIVDMSDRRYGSIRAQAGWYYLEREALVASACILHEPAPTCEREGFERNALRIYI